VSEAKIRTAIEIKIENGIEGIEIETRIVRKEIGGVLALAHSLDTSDALLVHGHLFGMALDLDLVVVIGRAPLMKRRRSAKFLLLQYQYLRSAWTV